MLLSQQGHNNKLISTNMKAVASIHLNNSSNNANNISINSNSNLTTANTTITSSPNSTKTLLMATSSN